VTNISLVLFNKLFRQFIQLVEIVAAVRDFIGLETQPSNHLLDFLEIYILFLLRVGVIEAEVANTVVVLCKAEVDLAMKSECESKYAFSQNSR
jgi:hypothetical protein